MGLIKEFKEFAIQGNVMDMAIGIVIGAAFGQVVASFVNDVIMPPIGLLLGGVDFTDLAITLKAATAEQPAVTLNYGAFIQTIVQFLIITFAIFLVIKGINALKREEKASEPAPAPSPEVELLGEIRDLLKTEK